MGFLDDLIEDLGLKPLLGKYTPLELLLRKETGCRRIYVPDRYFDYPTESMIREFLRIDQEDKAEYVSEEWDCDNFALALFANAKSYFWGRYKENVCFGMYRSPKHARCFFVDYKKRVFYIEPQTDDFVVRRYKPRFMLL